ncbi:hypothetical protein NQ318_004682 [Aromia moschata]|uniref:Uncharacterized protein n=1 Tax=Aromia moschata TaxID=1265417 RepID=A0AAV8Y841_9CUCU|nr:hypothetical protein NQ318_004682 [Aromia moschata]
MYITKILISPELRHELTVSVSEVVIVIFCYVRILRKKLITAFLRIISQDLCVSVEGLKKQLPVYKTESSVPTWMLNMYPYYKIYSDQQTQHPH